MALLDTVYVVSVKLVNEHYAVKSVQKHKVISHTKSNVIVYDYGSKVRVPIDRCFTTAEEAARECDSRANELIAKLVTLIDTLKKPAEVDEKLRGVFDEEDRL